MTRFVSIQFLCDRQLATPSLVQILKVQREMTRVTQEMEAKKGRKLYLERTTEMSDIHVSIQVRASTTMQLLSVISAMRVCLVSEAGHSNSYPRSRVVAFRYV